MHRPRRILVAGSSGSGKSTLARKASDRLGLPYTETDSLYHGPGWTVRESFVADVDDFTSGEAWVMEWQGSAVRQLMIDRAEVMLWLDLPTWRKMLQVTRRTLRRRLARVELWAGNTEPPLLAILTERDHIIRWAWRTRHEYDPWLERLCVERPGFVVRLRSHAQADAWLASHSSR
ncbi:AAA family ATPase [Nocardioides sp.]|uniref:AAA family ATPase n=1 Tax=Nocardioides sp. TaxID=35761 RepID=UPI0039E57EFD